MLTKILKPYKNLSKEIWILTLMTLINRAGAMVIPFLSLYLTKSLGFSLKEVSIIMTFFGLGSFFGTWTGGKLTDKIGYYKVMYSSLFFTGLLFFTVQFLETFWQFSVGIFVLTFISDMFRPAIWVAISDYSKEENRTRSITLVRIAINLGYAVGPATAGLVIAKLSYKWLFWIDGVTTIIAAIIVFKYLYQKKILKTEVVNAPINKIKPYKNVQFMIFWMAIFLCGFSFVQFIELWPLFYDTVIHLDEQKIGLILALNGFIIFALEMPIVDYIDKKVNHLYLIILGVVLFGLSFFVLTLSHTLIMVIISMILISIGEIFCFPFSNTYALNIAKKGNQGEYMAFYAMTFSAAFIVGPLGMYLVNLYSFDFLWYIATLVLVVSVLLLLLLKKRDKKISD